MDWVTLTSSSSTPGSIANWLNTAQLVSVASTIINEAESFIYRRLRATQMLANYIGTLTPGQSTLAVPSNFIQPEHFMITGINKRVIYMKPNQEVRQAYMYDGNGNRIQQQPSIYYFDGVNFNFDSVIDSINTYPYDVLYYQQPLPLSVSNTTNFVTSVYPRMMRCAIMVGASEFMKDAGAGQIDRNYWQEQLDAEINAVNIEQDQSLHSIQAGAIIVGGGGNDWNSY